jgi:hypothetical protein
MSPRRAGAISPLLVIIAEALDADGRRERPGEGAALRAFGALARVQIPARGIFAPIDDELYSAIDRIAADHLEMAALRKALGNTLVTIEPFTKRDEIESVVNEFCAVSDIAYFNAGLAFGITFAELRSMR